MSTDDLRHGVLTNDPELPQPEVDGPHRKPTFWDASYFTLLSILGAGPILCRDMVLAFLHGFEWGLPYDRDLAFWQNIYFCSFGLTFAIIGQYRTPRNTFSQIMPMFTIFVFLLSTMTLTVMRVY
jgi:hypothetical protein